MRHPLLLYTFKRLFTYVYIMYAHQGRQGCGCTRNFHEFVIELMTAGIQDAVYEAALPEGQRFQTTSLLLKRLEDHVMFKRVLERHREAQKSKLYEKAYKTKPPNEEKLDKILKILEQRDKADRNSATMQAVPEAAAVVRTPAEPAAAAPAILPAEQRKEASRSRSDQPETSAAADAPAAHSSFHPCLVIFLSGPSMIGKRHGFSM